MSAFPACCSFVNQQEQIAPEAYDFDGDEKLTTKAPTTDYTHTLSLEHEITVRTYDIDYANHVSNIRYLYWLEDMRNMLFEKYFPLERFMANGQGPVIASTHIEYKRPVKLFDKPKAYMWVSHIGNASLTIECEIKVNGELSTYARHVGVFVDLASGKPVRIPSICKDTFKNLTVK
jgi:acyl-CoA thioester hydrolase